MVKSFDDLISFLLDEIALCGEEGTLVPSLFLCAFVYPTFHFTVNHIISKILSPHCARSVHESEIR